MAFRGGDEREVLSEMFCQGLRAAEGLAADRDFPEDDGKADRGMIEMLHAVGWNSGHGPNHYADV